MRTRHLLALLALALTSAACGRNASREWRAEDHDQDPGGAGAGQAAAPGSGADDSRALVEAAWNSRCFTCHGRFGKGDGPNGPMVKAGDLTAPAFLDKNSDEEIAKTIRNGRNKMPAFTDLPPNVVDGLVKRIRAFRAKQ